MKTSGLFFILIAAVLAVSFAEGTFCPSSGFYPDPSNCQGYTLCYDDASGVVGVAMKCPTGMAYDREAGYCSKLALRKYC